VSTFSNDFDVQNSNISLLKSAIVYGLNIKLSVTEIFRYVTNNFKTIQKYECVGASGFHVVPGMLTLY
jgi:hypothetical protein